MRAHGARHGRAALGHATLCFGRHECTIAVGNYEWWLCSRRPEGERSLPGPSGPGELPVAVPPGGRTRVRKPGTVRAPSGREDERSRSQGLESQATISHPVGVKGTPPFVDEAPEQDCSCGRPPRSGWRALIHAVCSASTILLRAAWRAGVMPARMQTPTAKPIPVRTNGHGIDHTGLKPMLR